MAGPIGEEIQGFIDSNGKDYIRPVLDRKIGELEELVLSVMKKELDTIVNLGALIGFLLGIINILFNEK
ncbi:MAG: hypothetical protein Q4C61_13220 [Lachnospiraceae bacterium]|nr:hypothetical protein [Lachnospiraceae bacterium]